MKEDADRKKSQIIGLIVGLCLLPVVFVFGHFGQLERGFYVACLALVFAAAMYVKRNLIKRPLFIIVMLALFLIQLPIVFVIPIPQIRYPRMIAFPICVVDIVFVFAVISVLEKLFFSTKTSRKS